MDRPHSQKKTKVSKEKNIDDTTGLTSEELKDALSKSTEVLTKKWSEFAAAQLQAITGGISKLKDLAAQSVTSTVASSTPVSAQPDIRQWPAREHKGQISVSALITTNVASHAVMTMTVGIDYTKMSMVELYLCQSAIAKEIQAHDKFSQFQLDNTRKQKEDLAAQLEAAEQRKRDTEHKRIVLVQVLDEACRSLPDFDVQLVEEPEQRLATLKDYVQ